MHRQVVATIAAGLLMSPGVGNSKSAQAAAPAEAERAKEKPQQPTGPQDTITSSIPAGSRTSEAQTSVAAAPASYTVRSGDTVSGIAARTLSKVRLARTNAPSNGACTFSVV